MQALSNPRAEPVERSAQIISFVELNRARSLRALAGQTDAPREPHPWAYAFPRPAIDESARP